MSTPASCPLSTELLPTDDYSPEYTAMYNGCKFNFIDPPSSHLFCQQCKSLAHKSYQFLCCNSLICKQCIVLNTCPFCLKRSESFLDRHSYKLSSSKATLYGVRILLLLDWGVNGKERWEKCLIIEKSVHENWFHVHIVLLGVRKRCTGVNYRSTRRRAEKVT